MTRLISNYRPVPGDTGVIPLPQGWPAEDHTETDKDVLAAKLAFTFDDGSHAYTQAKDAERVPSLYNASKDPERESVAASVEPEIEVPGSWQREQAILAGEPDPLSKPNKPTAEPATVVATTPPANKE